MLARWIMRLLVWATLRKRRWLVTAALALFWRLVRRILLGRGGVRWVR